MAKEKFVRSKPHVNFLDGIKEKLGLAPKEPVEPPIEPLDAADEAPDAGGSMLLPRVGWEAGVLDESSGPGGAADHQPGSLAPNGGAEEAMFNPKELTVDKSVPWKQADDDAFKVETAEDGSSQVVFGDGAQGALPPTGEDVQSGYQHGGGDAGQNDSRFMKSRSGHQMDADEDNEAMGAEEGPNAGIQHDHVYQHNQTDLAFLKQNAQATGDADVEEGGLNDMVHKLPGGSGDAPEDGSLMLPEVGDEVMVGFEQGDMSQPVVIGQLWNGQGAPPDEAPPHGLPGGQTASSLQGSSSPGGGGGDDPAADDVDAFTAARFELTVDGVGIGDAEADGPTTLAVIGEQEDPAPFKAASDLDTHDAGLDEEADLELDD